MKSGNKKKGFANPASAASVVLKPKSRINRETMLAPSNQRFNKHVGGSFGKSFRLVITLLIFAVWTGLVMPLQAQHSAKVLTTDAGVQFDGSIFTVPAISETASSYDKFTTNAAGIAVVDDGLRRIFLNLNHLAPGIGDSDRINGEQVFEIAQPPANLTSTGIASFVSARPKGSKSTSRGSPRLHLATSRCTRSWEAKPPSNGRCDWPEERSRRKSCRVFYSKIFKTKTTLKSS